VIIMGWVADLLKEIPSAAHYKAKLEKMERENKLLKAENEKLKSELETLRKELATFKAPLEPDAEKILEFIAQNEQVTPSEIECVLGMNMSIIDMHLENLLTTNYIEASYVIDREPEYYLGQAGRRYLHAKGLR
jgi:predicted HTH transcriptional regulator